jgi:hypothetical protein
MTQLPFAISCDVGVPEMEDFAATGTSRVIGRWRGRSEGQRSRSSAGLALDLRWT